MDDGRMKEVAALYLFLINGPVKSLFTVSPAKAGVQKFLKLRDSGLRQNDIKLIIQLFTQS